MTQIPQTHFDPQTRGCSTCNLALIGRPVLEKMLFENNGLIHVYSHRVGTNSTMRPIVFLNINLLSILSFAANVSI